MTKVTRSDPSSGKQHLQSFGSFDPFASLLVLKEEKGEKEAKVNSSFPDARLVGLPLAPDISGGNWKGTRCFS